MIIYLFYILIFILRRNLKYASLIISRKTGKDIKKEIVIMFMKIIDNIIIVMPGPHVEIS